MKTFIQRWGQKILGVLHGFDCIHFRGMLGYLGQRRGLLKDVKDFAGTITAQLHQKNVHPTTRQSQLDWVGV